MHIKSVLWGEAQQEGNISVIKGDAGTGTEQALLWAIWEETAGVLVSVHGRPQPICSPGTPDRVSVHSL